MNYGAEPADQVVRYTLEGTEFALKISRTAAKNFAVFALAVLRDQKKTHGKTKLVRLLREGKPVSFSYEGISYETSVQDVKLFPQGYAAILQHSDLLNEPSVILADIGGWTVDIMRLDNRIPNAASCRSLELGMIRCLDEIAEQVRRSLNLSLTSAQIENVLRGSPDSMDDRVKAIIQREAGIYARRILSAIAEAGLDCRAMPVVFLGGGAGLMKRYLPQGSVLHPVILDNDKLNAQAYERLASQVAGHAG